MRLPLAVAALALLSLALPSSSTAAAGSGGSSILQQINGWYPCGLSVARKNASATASYATAFQCAEVVVPLCHEGICKSDKTIDVFVRRLLADPTETKPAASKALWFLQGGPGASSANMESIMLNMTKHTKEKVDFYTLDHRGTGRSNFLECQAAQAFASGSPGGVRPWYSEYSNCIKDLLFQMDNHTEAYSVTSAAKDVEYLVDRLYGPQVDTFVFGMSYGTYFAERIMHLAPAKVKGYILDGVVAEDDPTFSNWNTINLPTDTRFVKLCEDDKFCRSKLSVEIKKYGNLTNAWRAVYKTLDTPPPSKNKCAALIQEIYGNDTAPSATLRNYLDVLTGDIMCRLLIPAIMHRIFKCEADDVEFLTTALNLTMRPEVSATVLDKVAGMSDFLSGLIKASEMWTFPSPTWKEEVKNFDDGIFSSDLSYEYMDNCVFTANKSNPSCTVFTDMEPEMDLAELLDHPPFVYKRDKYWSKFATIPKQASALVVNGKLDFMTPSEGGVSEFENLKGDNKLLVEFENGAHCTASHPTVFGDNTQCGFQIVASYVLSGGAVENVNTTCLESLPALNFADLKAIQSILPNVTSVDELYDSKASSSATSSTKSTFHAMVHKHHHQDEA